MWLRIQKLSRGSFLVPILFWRTDKLRTMFLGGKAWTDHLKAMFFFPLWRASCLHFLLTLFFSMCTPKMYLYVYISFWLNITLGLHPCMLGICSVKELCSPSLIMLLSRTQMKNIWFAQRWSRSGFMAIDHFSRPRLGKSSLQVHTENRICMLTDNELQLACLYPVNTSLPGVLPGGLITHVELVPVNDRQLLSSRRDIRFSLSFNKSVHFENKHSHFRECSIFWIELISHLLSYKYNYLFTGRCLMKKKNKMNTRSEDLLWILT